MSRSINKASGSSSRKRFSLLAADRYSAQRPWGSNMTFQTGLANRITLLETMKIFVIADHVPALYSTCNRRSPEGSTNIGVS